MDVDTKTIFYKRRKKPKYNLRQSVTYQTGLQVDKKIDLSFLVLEQSGILKIKEGYSWDGPSGPSLDTRNFMRGSLIHDALYQLLREERLPQSLRKEADQIIHQICLEDGMHWFRAGYVYYALRLFGWRAAKSDLRSAP